MPEILKFTTGADPDRDAWLTNFYTENHLAYEAFPEHVASPEQLNFIVHMGGEPLYYPCSDDLFAAIVEKQADTMLTAAYKKIWNRLERLVITTGRADSGVGKAVTVSAKFAERLQAVIRSARGQGDYRNAAFLDSFHLSGSVILGRSHGTGKIYCTLDRKAVTDILCATAVIVSQVFLPFIPLVGAETLFHGQQRIVDIKHHQYPVLVGLLHQREDISCYIGQVSGFLIQSMNRFILPIHVHVDGAGSEGEYAEHGEKPGMGVVDLHG